MDGVGDDPKGGSVSQGDIEQDIEDSFEEDEQHVAGTHELTKGLCEIIGTELTNQHRDICLKQEKTMNEMLGGSIRVNREFMQATISQNDNFLQQHEQFLKEQEQSMNLLAKQLLEKQNEKQAEFLKEQITPLIGESVLAEQAQQKDAQGAGKAQAIERQYKSGVGGRGGGGRGGGGGGRFAEHAQNTHKTHTTHMPNSSF